MQTQRLIILPCIRISRQKSSHFRLVIPRPEIHFLRLLIIVFPTVAERIVIFTVRIYLISERIILVGLDDFAAFIRDLHHIPMWISHIILLFGIVTLIGIHKVITTDVSFLHLTALRKFHNKLIPVPDENRLIIIHGLAGTQSLGIISKTYLVILCKRLCQLIQCIIMIDYIFIQPVVPQSPNVTSMST